ncbi:hypothetical protein ANN_14253 [Periplaneta americana]|uniref:Uncharacterized protein n=1 Tax=Periplaneta americana TaxID=6978 RepID=A0ABQ8SVT5_PERAM|nr:hypothetical protein ANN_14253 [Periplaneta americana]
MTLVEQYVLCRKDLRTTVVGIATTRLKLLHTSWDPVRTAKLCETLDTTKCDHLATALKDADYNTSEEVHGLSVTGSIRRIDIIAFKESTRSGCIIDPTVRFETDEEQPAEVDNEKKNIYNPTIPYYLQKYQLKELEVIGLLVGARGTATLFMKDVFKRIGMPTSIIPIVTLAALKGLIALLKNHLYSKSN